LTGIQDTSSGISPMETTFKSEMRSRKDCPG
jgi:hypothetical protein